MIATEPHQRTSRPGPDLVVRSGVSWRPVRGYGRRWRGRSLRLNWSPEQIAGWLKRSHSGDESYSVSHETIYRSLFVQARGVLKKELLDYLRSKRTIRRSQRVDPNGLKRGQIKDFSSPFVSDRQRLKIGRCLVIGRVIS